tara:strand:- start:1039 stop:1206 length:168 start_codon:yes stop_codon:yes gene_type:complete
MVYGYNFQFIAFPVPVGTFFYSEIRLDLTEFQQIESLQTLRKSVILHSNFYIRSK